tara:strand:- start:626 stop:1186 length:561 start_codon:yes stop_codon:yes gene_type:complete
MAKRKHLKGITNSFHDKFLSRNNDLNGYWALGMLYKDSASAGESSNIIIDLLQCTSEPVLSHTEYLCRFFNVFVCEQLHHYGLSLKYVNEIKITILFNISKVPKEQTMASAWGEIFKIKVELIDDLNKRYIRESKGWCWRHNPQREQGGYSEAYDDKCNLVKNIKSALSERCKKLYSQFRFIKNKV